jgi:ribosomal protein L40E
MSKSHKEEWAEEMARAGVRAVTISHLTHLSGIASRKSYSTTLRGKKSPPGGTPSCLVWSTKTRERSFHAALFLSFYRTVGPHVETRGLAFAHAYVSYWRAIGSPNANESKPILPAERANVLRKIADDNVEMGSAARSPVRTCRCRACGTLFLGLTDKVETHCHFCQKPKK